MPDAAGKLIVTTSQRPPGEAAALAREISARYRLPLLPRRTLTLARMMRENEANLLVCASDGLRYVTPETAFRYHPGMARVRINNLLRGRGDPMVVAMGLEPGFSVLDCTLGLATDAAVASFVVGGEGNLVGVEHCLPVYLVVKHGLANYAEKNATLREALRRIEVHWADCNEYLQKVEGGEFDVIYLDPFFDEPVEASSGIAPLRMVAKSAQPSLDSALQQAAQKARLRVVVKGRPGSPLFHRHLFQRFLSGTHSRIQYGVIEVTGAPR